MQTHSPTYTTICTYARTHHPSTRNPFTHLSAHLSTHMSIHCPSSSPSVHIPDHSPVHRTYLGLHVLWGSGVSCCGAWATGAALVVPRVRYLVVLRYAGTSLVRSSYTYVTQSVHRCTHSFVRKRSTMTTCTGILLLWVILKYLYLVQGGIFNQAALSSAWDAIQVPIQPREVLVMFYDLFTRTTHSL